MKKKLVKSQVSSKIAAPSELIARCGTICGICMAHLWEKNHCPGCRLLKTDMPISIARCKIRSCDVFKKGTFTFCFECSDFPCQSLKHLDKRYRTKYGMSQIENLGYIKENGLDAFLKNEKRHWICAFCGGTICVHRGYCYNCGKKKEG